ncbi:hypothetical protein CsSME_00013011 [Camellia sinensis var. sinensis]
MKKTMILRGLEDRGQRTPPVAILVCSFLEFFNFGLFLLGFCVSLSGSSPKRFIFSLNLKLLRVRVSKFVDTKRVFAILEFHKALCKVEILQLIKCDKIRSKHFNLGEFDDRSCSSKI